MASGKEYRRAEDDSAEIKLAKVRERIKRNFPSPRDPLRWRKDSDTRIVSTCGQFSIERRGEGQEARYNARKRPSQVLGMNFLTAEAAKEVCNRHASPLELETPKPPTQPPGG